MVPASDRRNQPRRSKPAYPLGGLRCRRDSVLSARHRLVFSRTWEHYSSECLPGLGGITRLGDACHTERVDKSAPALLNPGAADQQTSVVSYFVFETGLARWASQLLGHIAAKDGRCFAPARLFMQEENLRRYGAAFP